MKKTRQNAQGACIQRFATEYLLKKVLSKLCLSPIFVINRTSWCRAKQFFAPLNRQVKQTKTNNIGGTR
jgi:hypothetical protein